LEQVRRHPAELTDFNADKVRLLGRGERREAPSAKVAPAPAGGPQPGPSVVAATAPAVARCLVWPDLDEQGLQSIEGRLQNAGIEPELYDISLERRLGWWVYLPPFPTAQAAQAAIDDARQKGVTDIAPVRGGSMLNAVSLGAFPTLARARAHEKHLRSLGLGGVHLGPRPNSGSARLTIADAVPATKLSGLGAIWGNGRSPQSCAEP
jgi:hypothetical protein